MAASFTSEDVKDALQYIIRARGAPGFIRSDNGPEFIARDLGIWLQGQNIGTRFIEPGKPWQNGFAESFHSRLREECLNLEVFYSVLHAQVVLESWRTFYNTGRPHSSLGYRTPDEWAREADHQVKKGRRQCTQVLESSLYSKVSKLWGQATPAVRGNVQARAVPPGEGEAGTLRQVEPAGAVGADGAGPESEPDVVHPEGRVPGPVRIPHRRPKRLTRQPFRPILIWAAVGQSPFSSSMTA
ncbi:integrase core domain-containing protein [Deinococcus sp.]|uniref:integrase core domain-containing protein n=1 Tax=Deinococcus sp. TaxID=47478 RepID=UPI00345BF76E